MWFGISLECFILAIGKQISRVRDKKMDSDFSMCPINIFIWAILNREQGMVMVSLKSFPLIKNNRINLWDMTVNGLMESRMGMVSK